VNLVSNAIKFTDEGEVVVRAEPMEPDLNQEVKVRFSVSDQGIGISEEAQGNLFQSFFQAESSTENVGEPRARR